MDEDKIPKVNAELFKGEAPTELKEETYYAYLDSVEQVGGILYIRLDCILKHVADDININKETILNLPSIIIEISAEANQIRSKFNYNPYNLESQWVVIKTTIKNTSLAQRQYFNFVQVGNPETTGNYDLDEVILFNKLDIESKLKIKEIVQATTLVESTELEIKEFLESLDLSNLSYVNVYNVGQGNCNALVTNRNQPIMYFDVGGGSGANSGTYPANFNLCTTQNPSIILSHWDVDHIQTAVFDPRLLNCKWLVPKHSSISATAMHIAQTLVNRSNLICWNSLIPYYDFNGHRIVKCTGNPNNKNNSGLALFVKYEANKFCLLPGDATFNKIPHFPNGDLIGLVASHHGARSGINGMPHATKPAMLAYSFGSGNTHRHAHATAVNSYRLNGWGVGLETQNGNIALTTALTITSPPCGNFCSLNVSQQF